MYSYMILYECTHAVTSRLFSYVILIHKNCRLKFYLSHTWCQKKKYQKLRMQIPIIWLVHNFKYYILYVSGTVGIHSGLHLFDNLGHVHAHRALGESQCYINTCSISYRPQRLLIRMQLPTYINSDLKTKIKPSKPERKSVEYFINPKQLQKLSESMHLISRTIKFACVTLES